MLREDYVSLETAKLLKEKGFVVPYDSFRGVYINEEFLRRNPGQGYLHNIGDEIIEVCSIQIAMKWLREKHKITVGILFEGDRIYYEIHQNNEFVFGVDTPKSYEKSCEEAIKYALENLI